MKDGLLLLKNNTHPLENNSALTLDVRHCVGHEVVEDVVAPLQRLLERDPRLLEEVDLHVRAGQLARLVEVDPDELAL